MKKVAIRFSHDEYNTLKICFLGKKKFDFVFHSENIIDHENCIDLLIPDGQTDKLFRGLTEVLRAKGTINSVHTNFGRKIDLIIERLSDEFYG